jgi:hypothetical protein
MRLPVYISLFPSGRIRRYVLGLRPAACPFAKEVNAMPAAGSAAVDFFILTVKPTVDEFFADTYDIRRGRLAAIVLNHMADYWCWHLYNDGRRVHLEKVRSDLISECPEFSMIRDIADASKHHKLGRGAQLTSSEQITRPAGLFQAPFGDFLSPGEGGVFGEASNVILKLNNGGVQLLESVIRSVLATWESVLRSSGLLA